MIWVWTLFVWRNYKKIPYTVCVLYTQHAYMNMYINKCVWFIALKRDFESCFLVLVWDRNQIREQNSSVWTSSQGHFNDQTTPATLYKLTRSLGWPEYTSNTSVFSVWMPTASNVSWKRDVFSTTRVHHLPWNQHYRGLKIENRWA